MSGSVFDKFLPPYTSTIKLMADTWASFVSNGNTQAADDISRIGKLTFGDGDFSNAQKEAAATPGDGVSQQLAATWAGLVRDEKITAEQKIERIGKMVYGDEEFKKIMAKEVDGDENT